MEKEIEEKWTALQWPVKKISSIETSAVRVPKREKRYKKRLEINIWRYIGWCCTNMMEKSQITDPRSSLNSEWIQWKLCLDTP